MGGADSDVPNVFCTAGQLLLREALQLELVDPADPKGGRKGEDH